MADVKAPLPPSERQKLQRAVQAKVDRLNGAKHHDVLPKHELKKDEWYLGSSRLGNVAIWDGEFFITLYATGKIGYEKYDKAFADYAAVEHDAGDYFVPYKRIPKAR